MVRVCFGVVFLDGCGLSGTPVCECRMELSQMLMRWRLELLLMKRGPQTHPSGAQGQMQLHLSVCLSCHEAFHEDKNPTYSCFSCGIVAVLEGVGSLLPFGRFKNEVLPS